MSHRWTAADIPDMTGKVVIVTGANSGIGYETGKELARHGAQVVLACRNTAKARAALDHLRAEVPRGRADIARLDLANLASVRGFARGFREAFVRLDVLINNAGVLWPAHATTEDGFESHFGINHLGHFTLTGLLLNLLLSTPGSRVVTVSSLEHRIGRTDLENLLCGNDRDCGSFRAYARSKLANLLFAYELQRRLHAIGAQAISVAAHPGLARTAVSRRLDAIWLIRTLRPLEPLVCQPAAMGALPALRAATDAAVAGGEYYGPEGWLGLRGHPVAVNSAKASHDVRDARRLWQLSQQLTAVSYRELDPPDAG